ncbi:MAG: response regulator [Patescibacteria group bacterium]
MKTILLAEDDNFIIDIYAGQLRKEGYNVIIAKDGQMILDKIKEIWPDLIILDLNLPKIHGWEVLRILRNDPKTQNLKVIVISNINSKDYPDNFADFKVIRYFLKIETSVEDMIKAVKEILK